MPDHSYGRDDQQRQRRLGRDHGRHPSGDIEHRRHHHERQSASNTTRGEQRQRRRHGRGGEPDQPRTWEDAHGHTYRRRQRQAGGSAQRDRSGGDHRSGGENAASAFAGQRSSTRRTNDRRGQSTAAQRMGSAPQGDSQRRGTPAAAPGGNRATPDSRSQGNPRTGSHRTHDSGGGGGGQFGDRHGTRPTAAQARGYHGDDRFASHKGRSQRDRQFGSRRGHGSQRREDPRTRGGQ